MAALVEQALLALTLAGPLAGGPPPGPALLRAALTAAAYPAAALVVHAVLGARRPRASARDGVAKGRPA